MPVFQVYLITCLVNGKFYIGCTRDTKFRWCNGRGYEGSLLSVDINKYGWQNFSKEIIYSTHIESDASIIEEFLIKTVKRICSYQCYNSSIRRPYNFNEYDETRALQILAESSYDSSLRRFYREIENDDEAQQDYSEAELFFNNFWIK